MDEHFMILEYARYREGTIPKQLIPWEYIDEIRPSLQPYLAEFLFGAFRRVGIRDAFFQTFLIRLLSGYLAFVTACLFAFRVAKHITDLRLRKLWMASVCLLWFLPYLFVRFSSENLGGIFLILAWLCLPDFDREESLRIRFGSALLCGFLLVCSFYFRFQMAFAIVGLVAWTLWKLRPLPTLLAGLFFGALLGVGVNLLADYAFYGHWVLTPYNYFHANIVQDAASNYGVNPWYDYVLMFIGSAAPPLSIFLLLFFLLGVLRRPDHPLVWMVLVFLLGHISVPHKELRFLYPLVLPFVGVCLFGLESVWSKLKDRKLCRPIVKVLVVFNMVLLLFRILTPAKPNHYYYRFLYRYPAPVHLITLGRGIYDEGYNEIFLYRPKQFREDTLSGPEQLAPFLQANPCDTCLVMNFQLSKPVLPPGYDARRLYVYLPDFIVNIQLNDWQSRSDIWSIWQLYRRPNAPDG